MVFIGTYKEADAILKDIQNGFCEGRCRQIWRQHIKNAIRKKTNPLKLTSIQKKNLTKKLKNIKGKKVSSNTITRKQRPAFFK